MGLLDWLRNVAGGPKAREASADALAESDNEDDLDLFDPFPEPVTIEIRDFIDLHTIPPRDVKRVVEEYLLEAHRAGFRVAEVPITLGVRKSGYSKMAYTRSFWLGYARLVVRLWLTRRVVDLPASNLYAEVEDAQSRRAAL